VTVTLGKNMHFQRFFNTNPVNNHSKSMNIQPKSRKNSTKTIVYTSRQNQNIWSTIIKKA